MRNNFCFILLIVIASCSKQASHSTPFGFNMDSYITKRPFQVIFSEHTHDGGATARLSPLEFLSLGDTIQIVDSGYLVLVHYSGLFLEFKEDTIISVTELSNSIAQQLNINPIKAKSRIDIDLLFSDQGKIQYATGLSSICNPSPMEYVLPINTASEISASNPEFCVSWTSNLSTPPYIVQVKNIFDEIIDEIEVKENEINLDLSGYQNDGNLFIVKVKNKEDKEIYTSEIGIKIGEQYNYTPTTCNIKTAIKALEMAYFLENKNYIEATEYYKLAANLSDRVIYDELLEHFINRGI